MEITGEIQGIIYKNEINSYTIAEFETEEEKRILIQVMTSSEDLGRVIGKQGRTANAIRTLVQASSALKENKYVQIDFDKF